MLRIIECAASGVLLVIPDASHVWRREGREAEASADMARRKSEAGDHRPQQPLRFAPQPA